MANSTPDEPAPPAPPQSAAPDQEAASKAALEPVVTGGLARLNGTGFEPGKRYLATTKTPDGQQVSAIAGAAEDGTLATFVRCDAQGKYVTSIALDELGAEPVATAKFEV